MYHGWSINWPSKYYHVSYALLKVNQQIGELIVILLDININPKVSLIGFEDLGNEDAFQTVTLEMRLSLSGEYCVKRYLTLLLMRR
jgi:hypothetical protein